jgi:hypothetical protein
MYQSLEITRRRSCHHPHETAGRSGTFNLLVCETIIVLPDHSDMELILGFRKVEVGVVDQEENSLRASLEVESA